MYILIALLSAFFAAITTILCKCGLRDADSDAATALRTTIVLVLSIAVVWITGEWHDLPNVTGMTLLFLILSGCATGGSWLCYFKALKTGDSCDSRFIVGTDTDCRGERGRKTFYVR